MGAYKALLVGAGRVIATRSSTGGYKLTSISVGLDYWLTVPITSWLWEGSDDGYSTTYVSDRDLNWSYNTEGDAVTQTNLTAVFDAARSMRSITGKQLPKP